MFHECSSRIVTSPITLTPARLIWWLLNRAWVPRLIFHPAYRYVTQHVPQRAVDPGAVGNRDLDLAHDVVDPQLVDPGRDGAEVDTNLAHEVDHLPRQILHRLYVEIALPHHRDGGAAGCHHGGRGVRPDLRTVREVRHHCLELVDHGGVLSGADAALVLGQFQVVVGIGVGEPLQNLPPQLRYAVGRRCPVVVRIGSRHASSYAILARIGDVESVSSLPPAPFVHAPSLALPRAPVYQRAPRVPTGCV